MDLPQSPACERNKEPILAVLKQYLPLGEVLEIGHGTGQHAVYFSNNLEVTWYPADMEENNWMMTERLKRIECKNIQTPLPLTIGLKPIGEQINRQFDSIFSANTFHIMDEIHAYELCENLHQILKRGGRFFLYGPFKFEGEFTSESNSRFDQQLKSNNPNMGIRDFEKIVEKLSLKNIHFKKRHNLPANNQLLIFQHEV